MARAGWNLVRESGRIFLEAAPANADPALIGPRLAAIPEVVEIHDLHVWQITSGQPSLSAHVLVRTAADCHAVRGDIETVASWLGVGVAGSGCRSSFAFLRRK